MSLPATAYTAFAGDLTVCRVSNGMWQVSAPPGPPAPERAWGGMARYVAAAFTTSDLADHYGPAEELVGELRRRLAARGDGALATVVAFTKWVPRPGPMTRAV